MYFLILFKTKNKKLFSKIIIKYLNFKEFTFKYDDFEII